MRWCVLVKCRCTAFDTIEAVDGKKGADIVFRTGSELRMLLNASPPCTCPGFYSLLQRHRARTKKKISNSEKKNDQVTRPAWSEGCFYVEDMERAIDEM